MTTHQVLHHDADFHEHGADVGLDYRYPPLFVMAAKAAQLALVGAAALLAPRGALASALAAGAALALLAIELVGLCAGACSDRSIWGFISGEGSGGGIWCSHDGYASSSLLLLWSAEILTWHDVLLTRRNLVSRATVTLRSS